MDGEGTTGIEDVFRRNIAALRSKAGLTQQQLADEMLLRGIAWTRETVAQAEATNRRLGLTEAIALAACLDVPVARLAASGAATVAVGESEWTVAYLGAAIAGTTGDIFPPESYASRPPRSVPSSDAPILPSADLEASLTESRPLHVEAASMRSDPRRRPRPRSGFGDDRGERQRPLAAASADRGEPPAPPGAADRLERRLRLRVTTGDVENTAQRLWSRSLESERERRVADHHASSSGSVKTIRGHVTRDLDRELAHELELTANRADRTASRARPNETDDASWEATRLNMILANKGYSDSDVTRWWNFTRHHELGNRTIAEAWSAGRYSEVSRLVQSLPDKRAPGGDYTFEQ